MSLLAGRRATLASLASVVLLAGCAATTADPQAVLRQAEQATGAAQVRTLRFAASGSGSTFGQAFQPGTNWPRLNYSTFSRLYDYETGAMREELARSRAEPTGGGAVPLMGQGEQRQVGLVNGQHAWNMAGPAPAAAPVALDARVHDLWISPHGVLKAARRHGAVAASNGGRTALSFTDAGRYRATAFLAADGLVERVESVQPNAVMGDVRTVTHYTEWRDIGGGVRFPGRIRQLIEGVEVLDLKVSEAQANVPAAGLEVPAMVSSFAERAVAERAADGVWFIGGGSHNSVAIEMADHVILVEAPLNDGRTQAVLQEVRRVVPNKPIRFAINSHHHFDHAGGLRAAAAEGITLVTSEQGRSWFERTLANPNAIRPDALQRSGRRASLIGVDGRRVFSDASRTVEVHMIEGGPHAQGFQMVWLPRERLLVQADAFTPGAPGSPPPATPNANHVSLVQSIERLRLNVDRILPLHGRIVPMSELLAAVGRR
ncbi:MAG TPA: MBL fold metallo-hydrolase [Ramlibacter sp.]|nr:MBL fold metallo-hydrolase [Ramlibacter sp.]